MEIGWLKKKKAWLRAETRQGFSVARSVADNICGDASPFPKSGIAELELQKLM